MERRSSPRASLPGVPVTYESATGDRVEADTLDVAPGGLFVRTSKVPRVGRRLVLDLRFGGSQPTWSALGRVVWVRESDESATRPQGMGVKLIDADDAAVDAIARLVADTTGSGDPPSEAHPRIALDRVSPQRAPQAHSWAGGARVPAVPESAPGRRRLGAGRWVVALLVLVAAATAAYAYASFNAPR